MGRRKGLKLSLLQRFFLSPFDRAREPSRHDVIPRSAEVCLTFVTGLRRFAFDPFVVWHLVTQTDYACTGREVGEVTAPQ